MWELNRFVTAVSVTAKILITGNRISLGRGKTKQTEKYKTSEYPSFGCSESARCCTHTLLPPLRFAPSWRSWVLLGGDWSAGSWDDFSLERRTRSMHTSRGGELLPNHMIISPGTDQGWALSAKCWSAYTRPAQPEWRRSAWLQPAGSPLWPRETLVWLLPFALASNETNLNYIFSKLSSFAPRNSIHSVTASAAQGGMWFPSVFFSLLVRIYNITFPVILRGIYTEQLNLLLPSEVCLLCSLLCWSFIELTISRCFYQNSAFL